MSLIENVETKNLVRVIERRCVTQEDKAVSRKFKELREFRGLSQQTVADAFGLTFQQIQKYETGINKLSAGRLFQAADLFGVDADYFRDGSRTFKKITRLDVSERTQELIDLFNSIRSKAHRDAALVVLKAMASMAKPVDRRRKKVLL